MSRNKNGCRYLGDICKICMGNYRKNEDISAEKEDIEL